MAPNPFRLAKRTPWYLALQAGMIANEHWKQLDVADRRRLRELIAKSKGRPGALSARERAEVKRIVSELDALGAGRKLLPVAGRRRGRRK